MDKKEALEICHELWAWMRDNSRSTFDTSKWPGWVINGGEIPKMSNNCPCCEYATIVYDRCVGGKNCPLTGYAWNYSCLPDEDDADAYSFYTEFGDDPKKVGQKMVDACKRALEDLNAV